MCNSLLFLGFVQSDHGMCKVGSVNPAVTVPTLAPGPMPEACRIRHQGQALPTHGALAPGQIKPAREGARGINSLEGTRADICNKRPLLALCSPTLAQLCDLTEVSF